MMEVPELKKDTPRHLIVEFLKNAAYKRFSREEVIPSGQHASLDDCVMIEPVIKKAVLWYNTTRSKTTCAVQVRLV